MLRYIILSIGVSLFVFCAGSKKNSRVAGPSKADTLTKNSIQSYNKVIPSTAVQDEGLFTVQKVNERFFFEIPDSMLNRDMLIVNRIVRSASGARNPDGTLGYGGDQTGRKMVRFVKGPNNKLFIEELSFLERSADSSANGMYWSVHKSNLNPIIASFPIKAFSPDSLRSVIDVTDLLNGDNNIFFFDAYIKGQFGLEAFQADKSYIGKIQSFPMNLEIKTLKTWQSKNGLQQCSYEINNSIVLLPKEPMRPRYEDPRVGYFGIGFINFDANPQGIEHTIFINRWRLEPKDGDMEKYKRGELVEPQKPIVFYIDPATPKKWVPYFIQGVNDWQKAFEKAGFSKAIYALEAPANDPEWSLEDARHNAIIYKASRLANASGPHIHDPRSGEILETHINWYHNVMELLHNWYTVQAGAIDARVRQPKLPDTLMGQLIRFVIAHEVGHTLGLAHNMAASSTVPVEKLRDKKWVAQNGHTPSIMDYARFNYVAQPEDSISEKGIFPRIGVYDEWAIEWGYKLIPQFKDQAEERVYMTKWITERISKNPFLWYGFDGLLDPRMQTEDLSDDVMQAGRYGIQNLKRIVPHVVDWTKEPGKGYNAARLLYDQVTNQYKRYLYHASNFIGSTHITHKTVEEKGPVYTFCNKEKQQAAVRFLQDELFTTPTWIMDSTFFFLFDNGNLFDLLRLQDQLLANTMHSSNFANLLKFQSYFPGSAYTPSDLLHDLEAGIWHELKKPGSSIDIYRRNLQKSYIKQLVSLVGDPATGKKVDGMTASYNALIMTTDLHAIFTLHAKKLLSNISAALLNCKDTMTRSHLEECKKTLHRLIYPAFNQQPGQSLPAIDAFTDDTDQPNKIRLPYSMDCWRN